PGPVRTSVADSVRDLDGLHASSLGLHRLDVLRTAALRAESDYGGDALRNTMRLDDVHLLLGQAGHLAGGQDDVSVVGQEHDLVVRHAVDCGEHVLRARVHGLAAFDDAVHAQSAKDVDQAAAGDDRHEADAVCALRPAGGALAVEDSFVLGRHVSDVELHQLSKTAREGDHARGVVGLYVDL